MADPNMDDGDSQDVAETFDETHNVDEDGALDETRSFEPDLFDDVYDVTAAEGDDDEDDEALDAADYDPDDLDDDDLEEDEDDTLNLEGGGEAEYDDDEEDEDAEDGVLQAIAGDAEVEYVDDLDDNSRPSDRLARRYESGGELSDAQVRELGYGKPASEGSGASADDVEQSHHPRQEKLLDAGIEETFPASDPVSVKRIT